MLILPQEASIGQVDGIADLDSGDESVKVLLIQS